MLAVPLLYAANYIHEHALHLLRKGNQICCCKGVCIFESTIELLNCQEFDIVLCFMGV